MGELRDTPGTPAFTFARCSFYVRRPADPADPAGFTYTPVRIGGPRGPLETSMPPRVGDLIWLGVDGGQCRVVDVAWLYPSHGSHDWPYGETPRTGPLVDVICEPAAGPFVDEVVGDEGEP